RTDDVLDGVEDGWMVDDLVDPGEQEMRLEIVPFGEFSALGRLELLHGASVRPRLLGGERVDRVDEAVAVVALDLRLGQLLAHRRHPTPQRPPCQAATARACCASRWRTQVRCVVPEALFAGRWPDVPDRRTNSWVKDGNRMADNGSILVTGAPVNSARSGEP